MMVYSTTYDKSADRQVSDRTNRPPPDLFVPGRDLRYRSGLQQYRGMVVVDSRGRPAAQGSAVLSSACREFGIRIRRLRLRAEPVAGRFRRTDPAFAGRRDFRQGQIRRLSTAQSVAELASPPTKKAPCSGRLLFVDGSLAYFAAGLAGWPPLAFCCSSSCSFFWVSSNTFGSVGGPS